MFESLSDRARQVLGFIVDQPRISVAELASSCGISEVAVRSILRDLEKNGLYVRAYGGGIPGFHPEMLKRIAANDQLKQRLARVAAETIQDGDDLMLVGGTTTSLMARYLYGKANVKVITNSTLLMQYARTNGGVKFIFTGGDFRPELEAMLGPVTVRELRQFHVRTLFTGIDGFVPAQGFSANLPEVAEVVQTMHEQADRTVVVTDSSKFLRTGFAAMLPLKDVDMLITDDGIPQEIVVRLEKIGIEVRVVDLET